MSENYYEMNGSMFEGEGQRIPFHKFKNGQHKFRLLPPFLPNKLFHKVSIHWGFTNQDNKVRALQCSKDYEKRCPICELVEKLESRKVAYEQANKIGEMKQVEKLIGDHKRKPNYMWNILTAEGEYKVLQLSWNGHDSLLKKVQFLFNEKKINVTSPKKNFLMWCERSGEKAKTRFVYELLEGTEKEIEVPKLYDLTKDCYEVFTYDQLAKIVADGCVVEGNGEKKDTASSADKTEDFMKKMNEDAGHVETEAAPAVEEKKPEPAKEPEAPKVPLNTDQNDEVQKMLAALNKVK